MFRKMLENIAARPRVYDWIQAAAGVQASLTRMRPYLNELGGQTILDVGAGTGIWAPFMPEEKQYIWFDLDAQKLQGFRAKGIAGHAILGDATRIPLRDQSVDVAFCSCLSHHLDDAEARLLFEELARVCRRKLIFLDAIYDPDSLTSRLLWKYDRGSHPRSEAALHNLIAASFELVHLEKYKIHHTYRLWIGDPRRADVAIR